MVLYLPLRAGARAIQDNVPSGPKIKHCAAARACDFAGALLCCCCARCPSWAGRPVRVYEVDVEGQSTPAVQDAMRQALVRATGRRESADDPALAEPGRAMRPAT